MTILSKDDFKEGNLKEFGRHLHWARAEKALSINCVAKLLNCEELVIDKMERGEAPLDVSLLQKLLKIYKCKLIFAIEGWE